MGTLSEVLNRMPDTVIHISFIHISWPGIALQLSINTKHVKWQQLWLSQCHDNVKFDEVIEWKGMDC